MPQGLSQLPLNDKRISQPLAWYCLDKRHVKCVCCIVLKCKLAFKAFDDCFRNRFYLFIFFLVLCTEFKIFPI